MRGEWQKRGIVLGGKNRAQVWGRLEMNEYCQSYLAPRFDFVPFRFLFNDPPLSFSFLHSHQSLLFSFSTFQNLQWTRGTALKCNAVDPGENSNSSRKHSFALRTRRSPALSLARLLLFPDIAFAFSVSMNGEIEKKGGRGRGLWRTLTTALFCLNARGIRYEQDAMKFEL